MLLVSDNNVAVGVSPVIGDLALIVATAMALFAFAFGTRHAHATEHQHGLILAIASESIVKLVAFIAVGAFVSFVVFGPHELLSRAMNSPVVARGFAYTPSIGNFVVMTRRAFFAVLLLPRHFHGI